MSKKHDRSWDLPIDYLSSEDREFLSTSAFQNDQGLSDWQAKLEGARQGMKDQQIWDEYLAEYKTQTTGRPHKLTHSDLVLKAKQTAPKSPGNTVTDFCRWLYSLYLPQPRKKSLEAGKVGEKAVERTRARFAEPVANSKWDLFYKDPLEDRPPPKKISRLEVNGKPLWGIPDLVFRHQSNEEILIIERKITMSFVPRDGWPNLRGQLWCYAQIDEWANTPSIRLVGEVWKPAGLGNYVRSAIRTWWHNDQAWLEQNEELFNLYGGAVRR